MIKERGKASLLIPKKEKKSQLFPDYIAGKAEQLFKSLTEEMNGSFKSNK